MMQPSVSVLMCVHNGEKFLDEAVESVLAQTFRDFEFIIVDDASTDGTPELLEKAVKRDSRVRVVRLDQNKGLTNALNVGLTEATGRYVARIDADDRCLPNRLQVQHDFLEQHPDYIAVGCGHRVIDDAGKPLRVHDEPLDDWQVRWLNSFNPAAPHPAYFFRRLDRDGERFMYDAAFRTAQDFDLWSRMARQGRVAVLSDVLLDYRRHEGAITVRKRKEQAANCRISGMSNLRDRLPPAVSNRMEVFFEVFTYNRRADSETIKAVVDGFDQMVAHDLKLAPSSRHRRWLRRTASGLLADCLLSRGGALRSPRGFAAFLLHAAHWLPYLVLAVAHSPKVAVKSLAATGRVAAEN